MKNSAPRFARMTTTMRIATLWFFLSVCLSTSFAAGPYGNGKIDTLLSEWMASVAALDYPYPIPISTHIVLPEPRFDYPDKNTVSADSLKNYSLMVQDSLNRHLTSLRPAIDSLFARYELMSVATNQRISL